MDVRRAKRRLYTCLHCDGAQRLQVSERYRMTSHVYRHHFALDKSPFYCTLCQFRCMTMQGLEKHALQPRHIADVQTRGGEPRRFLAQNFNPKMVSEGTDFRLATADEIARRGTTLTDDGPGDDEEVEGADQGSGLISIQVTPQILAELMSNKLGGQTGSLYTPTPKGDAQVPEYDPLAPSYTATAMPSAPLSVSTVTSVGTALRVGAPAYNHPSECWSSPQLVRQKSVSASLVVPSFLASPLQTRASSPALAAPAPVYGATLPLPPASTRPSSTSVAQEAHYAPSFGDTFITSGLDTAPGLSSPSVTRGTTKSAPLASRSDQLNTPITARSPLDFAGTPEVEDIREQLMGKGEDRGCFSPAPAKRDCSTQTKVTHTSSDMTPTASSVAINQLGEILKTSFEKVYSAIERNSRRIEEVGRATGTVAEAIARMERSVDQAMRRRPTQEQGCSSTDREKRPRLEKENQVPRVSSVAKAPKQRKDLRK